MAVAGKIPFFIFSAVFSILTYYAQHKPSIKIIPFPWGLGSPMRLFLLWLIWRKHFGLIIWLLFILFQSSFQSGKSWAPLYWLYLSALPSLQRWNVCLISSWMVMVCDNYSAGYRNHSGWRPDGDRYIYLPSIALPLCWFGCSVFY